MADPGKAALPEERQEQQEGSKEQAASSKQQGARSKEQARQAKPNGEREGRKRTAKTAKTTNITTTTATTANTTNITNILPLLRNYTATLPNRHSNAAETIPACLTLPYACTSTAASRTKPPNQTIPSENVGWLGVMVASLGSNCVLGEGPGRRDE
ncbi:hypothetical protein V499_04614 [Pseudogymnoascus sp. VKM F-103]|nr:hypothetical protein V499_04614 [Pseudogymnoascus sp. VKM F-103]